MKRVENILLVNELGNELGKSVIAIIAITQNTSFAALFDHLIDHSAHCPRVNLSLVDFQKINVGHKPYIVHVL